MKITTAANGSQNLSYFPVPANPIDFVLSGASFLTLFGTPADGDAVFPYNYTTGTGQLTLGSNNTISIGDVHQATAIVTAGGYVWVLDNEPGSTSSPSQILPWSVSSNGQTGVTLTIEPADPLPTIRTNPTPSTWWRRARANGSTWPTRGHRRPRFSR